MKKNINLNSIIYNEKLTRDDILELISQEDIFTYYIGEKISIKETYNSPLRNDDVPSFSFYYRRDNSGILMFYDFGTKECGDCIVFITKLFGLTYGNALLKIAYDFKLSDIYISANKRKELKKNTKIIQNNSVKIGIKRRRWQMQDVKYWKIFGICKATLEKYRVAPIEYVFFNNNPKKVDKLTYSYQEYKDDIITYKIYQPYSKKYKWMNNANYTVHQGYRQLPEKGELLIITKSLKDVMSLKDVVGINAIGLQSESVNVKSSVIEEYKTRFDKVLCLFDNDKPGIRFSEDFHKDHKLPYFFMPNIEGVTDFSDLVKIVGVEEAKKIFKKIIENEIK
jgi:hypothetical protein